MTDSNDISVQHVYHIRGSRYYPWLEVFVDDYSMIANIHLSKDTVFPFDMREWQNLKSLLDKAQLLICTYSCKNNALCENCEYHNKQVVSTKGCTCGCGGICTRCQMNSIGSELELCRMTS